MLSPAEPEIFTLEYADVKMDYLALAAGDISLSPRAWGSVAAEYTRDARSGAADWSGVRNSDTARWIRDGYRPPGLVSVPTASVAPRKRTRWFDEGDDLDLSRALAGDPTPFAVRAPGVKPGIRIEFECVFASGMPQTVLNAYGVWLAQLVTGFQASGHDLELIMLLPTRNQFNDYKLATYRVFLKRFGQSTDFAAWSPAFSPGGYRHIIFTQYAIHAEKIGRRLRDSLGPHPNMNAQWGATFDGAVLSITAQYLHATNFPAARMTELVNAALKKGQ